MDPSEPAILVLAEAVADGSEIDWDQAESSAQDAAERQIIQQLRTLSAVSQAARARLSVWGPLEIRGEVGSGTFGTVYRAWDRRLEREVALKLLKADGPDLPVASFVIKEGRLLARIRHPNIVTVYGADAFEGRVGIWMEFVSGKTLKEIVQEQGPFGAPEAALIGRDLCRALAAVHAQAFLHRDIKAQNVMRQAGGRTVLMDFGAGDTERPGAEPTALRGTPAYLAPEVLSGGPPTARSDLYSLGVLMYFLVSGEFPVRGVSLEDFRDRHAKGTRKLLRDVRPDLPSDFVRAVDAATAADPLARPESAGALEVSLEGSLRLRGQDSVTVDVELEGARSSKTVRSVFATRRKLTLAGALLALTALTTIAWTAWGGGWRRAARVNPMDSVAILPFRNLTGDTQDDYFSEGITADLIANLAALRDLKVIAGGSVLRFKDRGKTPVEMGRELNVSTILDASVRRSEDRVRIVAQLVDARTGVQIWSEGFDSKLPDIVRMKSDVSNRIAVALRGELSQRDMELLRPGRTYDYEAFNSYLKGRHYWGLRTEESVNRSIQYFHDALSRDPNFAPAYAGLADAYTLLGVYDALPRQEAYARASAAAEKAVSLDGSLAEAHASLGYAQKNRFEWTRAERSFKRAIELKPGYAVAHQWYSVLLTQHGRFGEAIAEIKIAMSLDPLSMAPNLQFASLLTMARRYDDAIAQYERSLQLDSGVATAYRHMAMAYAHEHLYERSLELLKQASEKSPIGSENQELKADIGYVYAMAGRKTEALAIASQLIERYRGAGEEVAGNVAAIYAGLQEADAAIEWLTRARDARDTEIAYLKVDPRWNNVRSDARFKYLLSSLGFTN